jgi:hypothetical protein
VSDEFLRRLYLSRDQQAAVISNGFDPSESVPPKASPNFSLLYTGTFYNAGTHRSDCKPVFSAVRALIEEGSLQAEDVLLQYAGNEGALFAAQASACGLAKGIQDLGFLSRGEVLARQQEAAVLLVATWNTQTEQGVITGKIYEYMLSHKPILATCSGDRSNSNLKEIIVRGALGFCYEEPTAEQDTPALKAWLKEAYWSWKVKGSADFSPNEAYIQQFGYDRLAGQVDQIITGVYPHSCDHTNRDERFERRLKSQG